jgi:hypothetical protein
MIVNELLIQVVGAVRKGRRMKVGQLIDFPSKDSLSLDKLKAAIELRFGVTYLEYIAFTTGQAGGQTDEIARKLDRAMQKESLLTYTHSIEH